MDLTRIAIIIVAILLGLAIFRFLGGCLVRLILIVLVIGAVIFVLSRLGLTG
jgi:hypothetical protein